MVTSCNSKQTLVSNRDLERKKRRNHKWNDIHCSTNEIAVCLSFDNVLHTLLSDVHCNIKISYDNLCILCICSKWLKSIEHIRRYVWKKCMQFTFCMTFHFGGTVATGRTNEIAMNSSSYRIYVYDTATQRPWECQMKMCVYVDN